MAKNKTKPAAAVAAAGDESPATPPPALSAEQIIARVCGVGKAVAARYAQQLLADERRQIVERYQQPNAHDDIRRLVLVALQPREEKPTNEPGHDGNGA